MTRPSENDRPAKRTIRSAKSPAGTTGNPSGPSDAMTDKTNPVPHRRAVNTQAAAEHLGCSPRQIRRLAQDDAAFPKPWNIAGPQATSPTLRWDLDELDAWISAKRVEGDSAPAAPLVEVDGARIPEFLLTPTMRRNAAASKTRKR